ncbi:GerAB/ArcD/ProY family transporter [Paenibacillus thailandensis]|uniref:GerAB/ArcD/ProY family transporter n=1 Tax=Paenibacillus thailandensis TaxID=393250 RepID=A0ABW5QS14_9BACL
MDKVRISPKQMFALMILFEFGTAIIIHIGLEANHVIWLSTLFAIPGGMLLYSLYNYLFREYPNLILSGYMRRILGSYAAWPLCLFMIGYFMYNASRNLREAGDLLVASVYDETPLPVINLAMIMIVIYVLGKGTEVFFRTAQLYLFIIAVIGGIGFLVLLCSGVLDWGQLWPYGKGDWLSALRSAYPSIMLFPFGELICFATVLPVLENKQAAGRAGLTAIAVSGVILAFAHALQIAVLGESVYQRSTFPLLSAISIVDIADFLQRLDALVMLTLIICVFFKMSMYCYAVVAMTADLFRLPSGEMLAAPVGSTVFFLSLFAAASFPEHENEGKLSSMPLLFLVSVAIPLLLAIVHLSKKTLFPKKQGGA